MEHFDVSIIGAGPAGSILARNLREKSDLKVGIFEKESFSGEKKVCGGGLNENIVKKLNLPGDIIDRKIKTYFAYMNEKEFNHTDKIDLYSVRREVFDRYLADRAVEAGAELHVNTAISSVNIVKKGELELCTANAKFKTKCAVFADGVSSKLRRNFNIGFHATKENHWKSLVYEIECNNPPDIMDFFYGSNVATLGYAWQFPKKDRLNVGIVIHSKYSTIEKLKMGLNWVINNHINNKYDAGKVAKVGNTIIPIKSVGEYSSDLGLLAIGDAAGFVRPFDGGGIEFAMESAFLASENIIEFIEKGTTLKKYDDEIKVQSWYKKNKVEKVLMNVFEKYPHLYHYFFRTRILPNLI